MILASKHGERENAVIRADFTGGLNTALPVEWINENQLAEVINMEIEHESGKLRTVSGTIDVLKTEEIYAAIYDEKNEVVLVVKQDRRVYIGDLEGHISNKSLGKLTGLLYPQSTSWETGVLIASGDKLQYFDGIYLNTIETPKANEVYIRAGRVVITNETRIYYSGVGDETFWQPDSNVESTSQWIEVGYKDGSEILGTIALSNNIMVLKKNRKCYRLGGEYNEWSVVEIGSEIESKGRMSNCAVGDEVFVLNEKEAYMVTNTYYGNTKPEDIALQVHSEIDKLRKDSKIRNAAPLRQLWIIDDKENVLIYDLLVKAWYKRQFNAKIIDIFSSGNEVYVVKEDRISKLDRGTFKDNDEPLKWRFVSQRLAGQHEYLLKGTKVQVTALNDAAYSGQIMVGKVRIPLPIPNKAIKVYENKSKIYRNKTSLLKAGRNRGHLLPQIPNESVYKSEIELSENKKKIYGMRNTYEVESRNVYRNHHLDVEGHGENGGFILQSIIMKIAEV